MSVGRNDPCPCGSGKKFKKCCYKQQSRKSDATRRNPMSIGGIAANALEPGKLASLKGRITKKTVEPEKPKEPEEKKVQWNVLYDQMAEARFVTEIPEEMRNDPHWQQDDLTVSMDAVDYRVTGEALDEVLAGTKSDATIRSDGKPEPEMTKVMEGKLAVDRWADERDLTASFDEVDYRKP